jgi:anti-sigma-K factor RskA
MDVTDDIHDLAPVYALDALDDDERRFFERHLATCAVCTREVRHHREAAAALAATDAHPVPAGLRDRVLAAADETAQEPAARRSGPRARLAAVAAVIVLGVAGVGGTLLLVQGGEAEPGIAELDQDFLAVAEAVPLDAPDGTTATFYQSAERDEGWLAVTGLEELGAEQVYQLWVFQAGAPVPAGIFTADDGSALVQADARVRGAEVVAVTVEPAGGVPQPTGPIVLSAEL